MQFRLRTLLIFVAVIALVVYLGQHIEISAGYDSSAARAIDGDGNPVGERAWAWFRLGWNNRTYVYLDSGDLP